MNYTIISAVYGNPDHSSAVIKTQEVGDVVISQDDTPEEWAALIASGVAVSPYTAPVPSSVSAFQAKAALMAAGLYEQSAAAAQAAGGMTLLAWQAAGEFQRSSPAIAALAAAIGLSDTQVDDLFIAASKITA